MHKSCLTCGKFCPFLKDLTSSLFTPMDTESLPSSEGKQPAAVDEVRASTSESLDYEAYGFSGLLQSPPRQSFPKWNEDLFEDGYDSDGEIVLPMDDVYTESDDEEILPTSGEEEVGGSNTGNSTFSPPSSMNNNEEAGGTATTSSQPSSMNNTSSQSSTMINDSSSSAILTDSDIKKMVVADLRKKLSRRGQQTCRIKAELIARLIEFKNINPSNNIDRNDVENNLKGFPQGSKWVEMPLKSQPVEESSRIALKGITHKRLSIKINGIIKKDNVYSINV